jgi:hypothetical protein
LDGDVVKNDNWEMLKKSPPRMALRRKLLITFDIQNCTNNGAVIPILGIDPCAKPSARGQPARIDEHRHAKNLITNDL